MTLTLILSLSVIAVQAGVIRAIKEAVSTIATAEAAYIGLKWAEMRGVISLPHIKWQQWIPSQQ